MNELRHKPEHDQKCRKILREVAVESFPVIKLIQMKYRNIKQLDDSQRSKIRAKVEGDIYDKVVKEVCKRHNYDSARFHKWFNQPTNE